MTCNKEDPFPTIVAQLCRILASWKKYVTKDNRMIDTNDGLAFASTGEEKDKYSNKKK